MFDSLGIGMEDGVVQLRGDAAGAGLRRQMIAGAAL
jgi:hypothetical protein